MFTLNGIANMLAPLLPGTDGWTAAVHWGLGACSGGRPLSLLAEVAIVIMLEWQHA
jgi:hypothetical protein